MRRYYKFWEASKYLDEARKSGVIVTTWDHAGELCYVIQWKDKRHDYQPRGRIRDRIARRLQ